MKIQQKYIWLSLIVLALVVSVVNVARRGASTEPIRIGGIFSLTGNGAAYGEPMRDGALLAVEEINRNGGIEGRRIELLFEDSQFDPKTAVSLYQNLRMRGVELFLSNGSAVSLALSPLAREDKTLLFETGAVAPAYSDGSPYTCRITLTAVPSATALADFAANSLHAGNVASLTLNDDYGDSMKTAFAEAAEARGLNVVYQDSINKDETDIRSHIAKLKVREKEIDALMVIPIAAHIEPILRELRELGWKKPILSDNYTIVNQNLLNSSLAEGVYFSNYDWDSIQSEKDSIIRTSFKKNFVEKYKQNPPAIAANGYDEIYILVDAIKNVGSVDANSVVSYLTTKLGAFSTAGGTFSFNSDCEASRKAIVQQVVGGKYIRAK